MGIKIDTEGEDYKVLMGAKNIIKIICRYFDRG